jgi:tetratricopeptide (TPR) repeat protein
VVGATECFKKAIALDPKYAPAHNNLGAALRAKGDLDGAIECYQKAIAADPKHALAYYNLGNALYAQKDRKGAIACYQKAIALNPTYAEAHCNLGHALREQGSFREALRCLKAGHTLGSRREGWHYPSAAWVQEAQRLVELDGKLLLVLGGKAQPKDAAERLALAALAQQPCKRQYALAARLYADAFAAKEASADLVARYCYNAACAAALAATGKGQGVAKPDDAERARLRKQALDWLQKDLARWRKTLDKADARARAALREQIR